MMSATFYPPQFGDHNTLSISPQISGPLWCLQVLKYQSDMSFFAVCKYQSDIYALKYQSNIIIIIIESC